MAAIEIIPKREIRPILKENIVFYVSLFLLILSLAIFFFLDYYQRKNLEELRELEQILTRQKTKEEIGLEQKVLGTKRKIENFSPLISAHKKVSKLFSFLEKITHPNIFFYNLDLKAARGRAELKGKTTEFKSLGQQLLTLEEEALIEKTELSDLRIGEEGGIEFSIKLLLKPEIFK